MKKDIVLHSPDPFLLMRMFTDLQMDGRFDDEISWNKENNPFDDDMPCANKLFISDSRKVIQFHTHYCSGTNPTLIPLTESNYLETLKMILE